MPAIVIDNLQYAYDREPVLAIDQLRVPQSQKLFLAGASGSGKTTLLSLLAGIYEPDAGELSVNGLALHALNRRKRDQFRADQVGYIFQMFNLVGYLSVLDNVLLPCRFSRRRRLAALDCGETLNGEVARLLTRLGLDPQIASRNITELSIGQAQRIAVARALIGKPSLIIADEPTSALDSDSRDKFIELLLAECEATGSTLVFVSHDESIADRFDRTLRMADINRLGIPS